jgi:aryl-alcohol dehydrogenase-like predicted oxidoreductase
MLVTSILSRLTSSVPLVASSRLTLNSISFSIRRFRKELGTDYIDVFLMHCLTEGDWTNRYRGVMDVLSEAKQKGIIRAHGCSCHSIEALRAAAASPCAPSCATSRMPSNRKTSSC